MLLLHILRLSPLRLQFFVPGKRTCPAVSRSPSGSSEPRGKEERQGVLRIGPEAGSHRTHSKNNPGELFSKSRRNGSIAIRNFQATIVRIKKNSITIIFAIRILKSNNSSDLEVEKNLQVFFRTAQPIPIKKSCRPRVRIFFGNSGKNSRIFTIPAFLTDICQNFSDEALPLSDVNPTRKTALLFILPYSSPIVPEIGH